VTPIVEDTLVGVGLLALLTLALETGFQTGHRAARASDTQASTQVGAIQGAMLGLLGLLLAFSFAAAGARFLERQDLIVEEANAIGTAYLRADLLGEPHRSELRAALARYTERRIEISSGLRRGVDPTALAELERHHAEIWRAAVAGVNDRRAALVSVLPPVNDVIDLHATRLAASRKHLPGLVLGLLVTCSALSIAVIGHGCGLASQRRALLTLPLVIVIATALWITIDLDHPRGGLIQLSDAPLHALRLDAPRQ
jgi:hypothetical protein